MPESQPRNLRVVREITRQEILLSVDRVPNSDRLLVCGSAGKVHELSTAANAPAPTQLAEHGRYVNCVRRAGHYVVSGGYDNKLVWWNLVTQRIERTTDAHSRCVRRIAVTADGSKLASVGDDMVCRIWDTATGLMLHELRGHAERTPQHFTSMLYAVTFSSDGRRLATGDRVGHVVVWDVESGKQLVTIETPTLYTWDGVQRIRSIGGIRGLAFSPDGTQLAIGGVGQIGNVDALQGPSRVEVFDWARRQCIAEFTGAQGIVNRCIYHPQGNWLCAIGGGSNGLVMFYDVARRQMLHQGNIPMHVYDAAFNEDCTTLYAVGYNKAVVLELRA